MLASAAVGIVVLLAIMADRRPEPPPLVDRTRRLADGGHERARWDEPMPASSDRVHVDAMPKIIKRFSPTYPDAARRAGIEGRVEVKALVGTDGRVKETRIASSDPVFDRSAEHAVRQYTFEPARSGGKPVAVWVVVPIRYTLGE